MQGRNHGWKVEGDQGMGPNTGALAPRAGRLHPAPSQRPGWVFGAGCPLQLWGFGGISPGKFCGNSDAKYSILVTTCCEICCFLKTTAKKLVGDQYFVGRLVSSGPYGCCAYGFIVDLGHGRTGTVSEPERRLLPRRRLLHPCLRRRDVGVVQESRQLVRCVPTARRTSQVHQLPCRCHRQQDRLRTQRGFAVVFGTFKLNFK